eukprot:gene11549-biopygen9219
MTSKLYDPLSMLSPVTLIAHLYIAALWDEKFGWDQPLPPSQVAKWQKIQNDLQAASEVHFPRWISFAKAQPVALHVFTDASKSALGVTAYLTQGASSFLLGSKSKLVARNKINLTIPQVELSAMFLGSQYCDTLLNILTKDFQSVSVHLWTDSEIALFWLNSKRKLKQFVQNKVDAINSKFPSSFWGHTSSTDNPADLASRGCSTVLLATSALWQHGPKWLCDPPSWPLWPKPSTSSTVVLSAVIDQHVHTQEFSIGNVIDVNRFNSYSRLLATSVYVYRFCHRTGTTGPPTTSEIEAIERAWFKSEQLRCYPQVVSYLSSHDSHDKKIAPPIEVRKTADQVFIDRNRHCFDVVVDDDVQTECQDEDQQSDEEDDDTDDDTDDDIDDVDADNILMEESNDRKEAEHKDKEFEDHRLRPAEDPTLFLWRLKESLRNAEPDLSRPAFDALLRWQFFEGLPEELQLKLLESDPKPTLATMRSFAQRFLSLQRLPTSPATACAAVATRPLALADQPLSQQQQLKQPQQQQLQLDNVTGLLSKLAEGQASLIAAIS